MKPIEQRIAEELGVRAAQVQAAIELLDGGSTVPFIARYRKEATGMLDDAQLRTLEERLGYLREMEERRSAILSSIREQGKLTDELEARIVAADSKARLEDIYLPYKQKRRTKAQIAREAGLEPLADALLTDPSKVPDTLAATFIDAEKGVADAAAALEGARAILVERFGEDADLIGNLREEMWGRGRLASKVKEEKRAEGAKFADYFDMAEPLSKMPAHRILAMFRGEKEGVLDLNFEPEDPAQAPASGPSLYEQRIARKFNIADRAGLRTNGSMTRCAGPGAPACRAISRWTCACGSGRRRRMRPCACSRAICAICCSPRPPVRARPWASIRASAPA